MSLLEKLEENDGRNKVRLEMGDFIGFCDMTAPEVLTSDQLEKLEEMIIVAQNTHASGDSLVPDAVYDRLMELLAKYNPDSDLIGRVWEEEGGKDFDDSDALFLKNPMYSIQTIKSFDSSELKAFMDRLPKPCDLHYSYKLNGWGIRVIYKDGEFFKARTRARSSEGRDITPQLRVILGKQGQLTINDLKGQGYSEFRGELVLSFDNFEKAKSFRSDLRSPFSGVSAMVRESATEEEWSLLNFVAYKFLCDGYNFSSKMSEYEFIESLGFEVPVADVMESVDSIADLESIIEYSENKIDGYDYYTDGVVVEVNDTDTARSLGQGVGNFNNYNVALKVGFWKQDLHDGVIQVILWMQGKTKLSPVAIIAEEADIIRYKDGGDYNYITDQKLIENYDELGVITNSGNKVRRIPLYEPSNMLSLDAYRGSILHFRYGGEAGVLPCFPDGTPLVDGRVKEDFE